MPFKNKEDRKKYDLEHRSRIREYDREYYRSHQNLRDKKIAYQRGERELKRKERQSRRESIDQYYAKHEFQGHDGVCSYCGYHGLVVQRFKEHDGVIYLCEKCLKNKTGRIEEGS